MAKGYYGNAEAVVYNLGQYADYFARQRQQKKMEEQALDKQINADLAKLSADGMRQQDVDGFLKNYQTLKNMSIQFRDAIRNPAQNPKAWQAYQNQKNELMSLIADSKAAKENTKALYDFRAKNFDKLDDDEFKRTMLLYNAPIGTAEHEGVRNFDQSQLVFKPERFDQQGWQKLIDTIKPVQRKSSTELPTGQQQVTTVSNTDPRALSTLVGDAFDNDYLHSRKFYTNQYEQASPEQISGLEEYARKYYDPNFTIATPKDFAVAANLYGRVERDMGSTVSGSAWRSQQAAADARQRRALAQQRELATRKDKDDDFLWEMETEKALKGSDTENVRRLTSRLETSTPGVERMFLKEGETTQGAMKTMKKELRYRGIDGKTKYLTPADYKAGVIVVSVPRVDKDGNRIKNSKGLDEYEHMAVSARDPYLKTRLNKIKTYAQGTSLKPLSDKIFQQEARVLELPAIEDNEFAPSNDNELNQ